MWCKFHCKIWENAFLRMDPPPPATNGSESTLVTFDYIEQEVTEMLNKKIYAIIIYFLSLKEKNYSCLLRDHVNNLLHPLQLKRIGA